MKLATVLLAGGLLTAALVARAAGDAPAPPPAPKPAPLTTSRPPERSLVLTPAQLQKREAAARPAPSDAAARVPAEPPAGVKFPEFSSVVPEPPRVSEAYRAPASAWTVAPALARPLHTLSGTRRTEKFPDLVTSQVSDPKLAAARADELARKPLTGQRTGAQGRDPKVPSFETRGAVPAALSAAQRAKHARADSVAVRAAERSPR